LLLKRGSYHPNLFTTSWEIEQLQELRITYDITMLAWRKTEQNN